LALKVQLNVQSLLTTLTVSNSILLVVMIVDKVLYLTVAMHNVLSCCDISTILTVIPVITRSFHLFYEIFKLSNYWCFNAL